MGNSYRLGGLTGALRFVGGQGRLAFASPALSKSESLSYLRLRADFELGRRARGAGTISLRDRQLITGTSSTQADLDVFEEVFIRRDYQALDVRDAAVLDLGGHKGYSGAWALRQGALSVISYEPHPENFRALEAARGEDSRWSAIQAAVGATARRSKLHVNESWTHSLIGTGDSIEVDVVAVAEVINQMPDCRRVMKMDVEGAEAEIFDQVSPSVFESFDAFALDPHETPNAESFLAAVGFSETMTSGRNLIFGTKKGP